MKGINRAFIVLASIALLATAFTVTSCKEPGETMSVSERMDAFETDLSNANYLGLKQHTHPDAAQYSAAAVPSYWTTLFNSYTDLTYSISGTTATGTVHGVSFTFYLKEDGDDNYKIYQIDRAGTPEFY